MRPLSRTLRISLTAILATVPFLFANPVDAQRGPDASAHTIVPGIDVLPWPGMPFTSTETEVWTRPLEGGGTISSYLKANVIRDGQGRMYREFHAFGFDPNVDLQKTLVEFTIYDFVAKTRTVCTLRPRLCHISNYHPGTGAPLVQPQGPFDQGRRTLTRESIGNQTIDDLPVVGTRESIVVSPGTLGNDMPITLSKEFWYSEDLKTNLSVVRKDPREGTQTITLINLSRNEPDPRTFAPPAGYTIVDDRHPAITRPQAGTNPPLQ